MPLTVVYTGDLSSLEALLFDHIKENKFENILQPHVALCGSHLLGMYLRRRAAQMEIPLFNVRFQTFDTLAADLLPLDYRRQKLISPLGELTLLRKIVQSQQTYFTPVQDKSGFLAALLAAIQDLIDGGVEEIPSTVQNTEKLRDIARIFHAYRTAMAPFISRSHALQLAAQNLQQFGTIFGTESLLVYGFYDFTFLQKIFLSSAAGRLQVTAFLPYRSEGGYDFSEPTLDFFKQIGFQQISRDAIDRISTATVAKPTGMAAPLASGGPARSSDLQRLQANWAADVQVRGAPDPARGSQQLAADRGAIRDGSVEIISASDETAEIREICREIQRSAQRGVDFSEMALLLRNPEIYVPLIADFFPAIGIPYYLQSGLPLTQTHPARSLLLLLELLKTDFPRPEVMEFASFAPLRWKRLLRGARARRRRTDAVNHLSAKDLPNTVKFRVSTAAWNHLSARAGVESGVEIWMERLAALSRDIRKSTTETTAPDDDGEPRISSRFSPALEIFHIEMLLEFIRELDRWEKQFAMCNTWSSLSRLTRKAMRTFFVGANWAESRRDEAWQQLEAIVSSMATLDSVDLCAGLEEWIAALRATLENDRLHSGHFQNGAVSVLSVIGARGTRHRVVFVPGMTEKGFPVSARQDAILLDKERREINQAARTGLPQKLLRSKEEQLLFGLCLQAAQETLVLTFPRLDIQTGRPRLPSHYLVRVAEALTGTAQDYQSLEMLPYVERRPLSQLAPRDPFQAVTENEFVLAFLTNGLRVPASLYNSRLRRSLEAYQARWSRTFTSHDGHLQSPDLLSAIARWADQQCFSPSRLETFATCPYKFFLHKLLRLEAIQEPEEILQLSALERGDLVHRILDTLMRSAKDKQWFPPQPAHASQWHALLDEIAQESFRQAEHRGVTGYRLLWELASEQILADLHIFIERELHRQDTFVPDRFEVNFGKESDSVVALTLSDGRRLNITGRIDRIDVNLSHSAVRVVDYKTGKPRVRESTVYEGGKKLQLPLYLLATAKLYGLERLEGSQAEYYFVTAAGKFQIHPFSGTDWDEKRERLMQLLQIISTAMRRGLFPAVPGEGRQHCKWCDYRFVCDRDVDRIYAFKSNLPELQFLQRLEDYV